MSKFAMRIAQCAVLLLAFSALAPANAASKNTSGDGSGIGGTGNSPGGGGIGGTGTKEQNTPQSMPDLPDRPEIVETPSIDVPELPAIDTEMNGAIPDALPEPPELPPAPASQ